MGLVKKKSTEPYINFDQDRYLNYGLSNLYNYGWLSINQDEKLTTEKRAFFITNVSKVQKRYIDNNNNVVRTIDFCTIPTGSAYSIAVQDKYLIVVNNSGDVFVYDLYGNLIKQFHPSIGIGQATGVHYSNLIVVLNNQYVAIYDLNMNLLYQYSLSGGSTQYVYKLFNKCYLVGSDSGSYNSAIIYQVSTGFAAQYSNGVNVQGFLAGIYRKIKGGVL